MVLAAIAIMAAPAAAQEPVTPVPGAFCTLFTNEEASAAFGVPLQLTGISGKSCTWSPVGASASDASLVPSLFDGTLADNKEYYKDFPGGIQDITVGGQPGLLRVDTDPSGTIHNGRIFTETLGQVLQLSWADYNAVSNADIGEALTRLTEAALPRMSTITFAEPTQQPFPSFRTDPDLAAMFPDTINGQALAPQTYYLSDLLALFGDSNDMVQQIEAQLSTQGKTLEDVTGGQVQVPGTDPAASIAALRIRGADVAGFTDAMLPLISTSIENATMGTANVAGRDVRTITDPSDGAVTYVLPSGEVIWLVVAQEPVLSEIIGALP